MSNEFKLYLLTRLDTLQGAFAAGLIIGGILLFAYYFIMVLETYSTEQRENYKRQFGKVIKYAYWLIGICAPLVVLLPSRNEAILIYAGGKTMDFIQADTSINKIPAKSTEFIIKYLDEKVKELDKEGK